MTCAKPQKVIALHSVYWSKEYRDASAADRLTLLWQKVLALTDNEDIFTEDTYRQVVRRFLRDMKTSHVEHVDLRIAPSRGRWRWMASPADGLQIFRDELSQHKDLSVAFLAGINLSKSEEQLDDIFDTLNENAEVAGRFVGLDINFLPSDLSKLERYLQSLRSLQMNGMKLNVHLGELFNNEISRQVLSRITPNRIGHGVRLLDEVDIVEFIRSHDICLDMCPTSNTLLGVVDWTLESPASKALKLGIPVSINTDDPVLFNTDIGAEIRRAGLSPNQLVAVVSDSRKYRYDG